MAEVNPPITPFKAQWPKMLLAIVILVLVFIITVLVVVYKKPESAIGRMLGTRLPFPLVLIGSDVAVTTVELAKNREALKNFYESQDFAQLGMRVDFTTEDGKKRLKIREKDLINKMLEDKSVEMFAREYNITVTDDQVAAETTVKMKELGTTDKVEQSLARLYGWTIADFQDKIVRPAMYEAALIPVYQSEIDQVVAEKRISEAEQSLKKKNSFADVAREFSQGETREQGGDLGWFRLEDLAPELRSPADNAKLNIPTNVVESPLGYHILLVEDTKLEDNIRRYHIRQIFTRKISFADWLVEKMQKLPVSVVSDEYDWQREKARIEFRSEEMRAYEVKLREKVVDDPSLVF